MQKFWHPGTIINLFIIALQVHVAQKPRVTKKINKLFQKEYYRKLKIISIFSIHDHSDSMKKIIEFKDD